MKKIILITIVSFFCSHSYAQVKVGFAEYQIVKNIDVKTIKTGQLFFTKEYSYFVEKTPNLDSLNQSVPENIKLFLINERNNSKSDSEFCYFNIVNNELLFGEFVVNQLYTIKENKRFEWQIQKDTKQIGNFQCRKAIGTFRGRKYIGWYAEDYGVSYGPWKSNGLPGLIIELYDEDKLVHFHANLVSDKINLDDFPLQKENFDSKKAISIKEFSEIRKEKYYNLISKLQSKLPRGNGNVKILHFNEKISKLEDFSEELDQE